MRSAQRGLKSGQLQRIAPGVVTAAPTESWPALIARERLRILAALYPNAVIGPSTAFNGGAPSQDGLFVLTYSYTKRVELPGLSVQLAKGGKPTQGDMPMMGRNIYFPSLPRMLLENLLIARGQVKRSVGRAEVEQRLIALCDARGEDMLNELRDQARLLSQTLNLDREFKILSELIGAVLGTRKTIMASATGRARMADIPLDANRIGLFEQLATALRARPLTHVDKPVKTEAARTHFAFLESYFSNFIEGTEFDIHDARGFVLQGEPITTRPKDSHDIIGVFRQALNPGWANQTLSSGEPVLNQLRERHADQMRERPEVGPGEFKTQANRAGNTEFVLPKLVRGTLIEGSKLLPTVPAGSARALFAMFLVAEVHPFADGNGRLARLVMNSELSVMKNCRIIVPTLFREEYLDCLRVLSRQGDAKPFLDAMQWIHQWTGSFDYEDLDRTISEMARCNAFERSRTQYQLIKPALPLSMEGR